MEIIKSAKEINYYYFGLNKGNLPNGHFLANIVDVFVNPAMTKQQKFG